MDVAVWVTCLAVLPNDLPNSESWNVEKWDEFTSYVYPSPNHDWQLTLEKLDESAEPLPETLKLNTEVKYGYVLSLEPIGADTKGYEMLDTLIKSLASKCEGAVIEGFNEVKLYESGT